MKEQQLFKVLSKHAKFASRYFVFKYNKLPTIKTFYIKIDIAVFNKIIIELYPEAEPNLIHNRDANAFKGNSWQHGSGDVFCHLKNELVVQYKDQEITLCHGNSISTGELEKLQDAFLKSKSKKTIPRNKFFMIKKSEYGFNLTDFKIKDLNTNISENYNDDLVKVTPSLMKFINEKDNSGIILFHGKPGGGKTSYIRSLISTCNAKFIYIPNNLFDHISDPTFVEFMSNFPNSVIILEDCEDLLKAREMGQNGNGISNLLNLGDGLLGDAMKLKIICTFNCDLAKIDAALLRKGRLIYRYEFGPLAVKKVNHLFEKLEIANNATEPLTLADVYNLSHNNNSSIERQKIIGFAG